MSYLLHSKRLGFFSDHGFTTDAAEATRLDSHSEARAAARAMAVKHRVSVDVLASAPKTTWRTRQSQHEAATKANGRRIDSLIASMEQYGLLKLSELKGRKYSY